MATNDLKIDKIKAKINQELNALIDRAMRDRATGMVKVTVEVPVSQGGISQWSVDGSLRQVGG